MLDIARCKPVVASILLGGLAFAAAPVIAHPPHSPYDDSVFAPIKRFGPRVAVEVLASGLVAPLKGVDRAGRPPITCTWSTRPGRRGRSTSTPSSRTLFFDVAQPPGDARRAGR